MDLDEYFAPLFVTTQHDNDHGSMTIANGLQFGADKRIETVTTLKFARIKDATRRNDVSLQGISMTFSNGQEVSFGKGTNASEFDIEEIQLQPGERLSGFNWWFEASYEPKGFWPGPNFPPRPYGFQFETQFGRKFESNPPYYYPRNQWKQGVDAGCGLLIGGQASDFKDGISRFSLFFLKPVKSLLLRDVTYSTLPTAQNAPVHMVPYLSKTFTNHGSNPATWTISETDTDTESFSWTVGLAVGLSMTTSVSAGMFDIVEINDQITWQIDASVSTTSESSESKQVSWTYTGEQPAHSEVEIDLTYGKGSCDLSFVGTMEVTMASGLVFTGPIGGKYAQSAVGVGQISINKKPLAE